MRTNTDTLDGPVEKIKSQNKSEKKLHPWRICPLGTHFVKAHKSQIPPSKEHPDGSVIKIQEHCAINPSKKDILTFDEIQSMTQKYFSDLKGPPKTNVLKGYPNADKFDVEIRGWTRYWNDIFFS